MVVARIGQYRQALDPKRRLRLARHRVQLVQIVRIPRHLAIAEIGCAWRDAALSALQASGRDYRIAYASDTSMG